ncbi:lytic murein transglycosylase [Pedococcus sp. KACC 23699]|uniref:Lytic murein transglycosylase n=1 Tax=Pedococcus sp. KACC 23699 TaxID=3149228 RepID=A0AAU7JQG6_9MICO
MRALVKLGVVSALAAAVVTQAASTHGLRSAVPTSESSPLSTATLAVPGNAGNDGAGSAPDDAIVVDVPDAWSFDDAHGRASADVVTAASRTAAPRRPATPRKPPKPPAKAKSGALPAAGTPQAVLAAAYVSAAARAPQACHLRPAHLAAIGQVESGSVGGRRIDDHHRVTPTIYGPLLDGGPFAVVRDTDRGAYDGASDYDRAVGPLQFLPGTWRWAGRDGDGDGRRDPQNVFDAALATADYLCRDGRDLSRSGDLRAAILTYNWSGEYAAAVSQWVSFFSRHGLAAMDDVAFRVGSGGRASAMAIAKPHHAKDAKKAKKPKKTKKSTKAAPPTTRPGSQPTPTGTASKPEVPVPSPTVTTPVPDPTTPAPDPTTAPPVPSPTPSTSVPPVGTPSVPSSTDGVSTRSAG